MNRFLFILVGYLFTEATSLLYGKWRVHGRADIQFEVDETQIKSYVGNGGILKINHKSSRIQTEESRFHLQLNNLEIIKRPSDWYNAPKYAASIALYHRLKKDFLELDLFFLNETSFRATVKVGEQEYPPFILERNECIR